MRAPGSTGASLHGCCCRLTVTLNGGATVVGELRDGGRELAIDESTIDPWCQDLWEVAGRPSGASARAAAAVSALPQTPFTHLLQALAS